MRVAFVGKGGSGKSTISWLITNYLGQRDHVLAIDADYNMDLAHNLGWNETQKTNSFISEAEGTFYTYLGLSEKDFYVDLPKKN